MPLTLTLSEGVIPKGKEPEVVRELTSSMLKWHELSGNSVMTPNITANVHIIPEGLSFSGGEAFRAAWVEWKVPSFAFADREIQKGFGSDTVEIIRRFSGGKQPAENIYFNVVHTVDGAWNLDGQAMSNEELGAEITKG